MLKRIKRNFSSPAVQYFCHPCIYPYVHVSRTEMEEQALAERCKRGDRAAYKELYERYAGRLLGVCLRYAGRQEVAEDLLHDGFLRIFSSFDKFTWRGEGSLKAWMERVVVNLALQYLRRNNATDRPVPLDAAPEAFDEPDTADVDAIPREVLMGFIAGLPTGYRTVLNLYVFEGKSHKEIAALLGINEKSSASQLTRAKASLAVQVREWIKQHS